MEENKIIIDVEINSQEASKRVVELTGQIARQRNELAKQNKILKDSNGENKEAAKAVSSLKNSISENNKELRQAQKEAKAESGSINALRSSIAKLNAERNNLNTQTAEGSKRFAELTEQLKVQREQVNEASKAAGSFKDNIGNYTESVKEAIASSSIFGDTFGQLVPLIKSLNVALKGTRIAFLAIPFTAVVALLATFLTQTKEGAQLLERFGTVVRFVFSAFVQKVKEIAKNLGGFIDDVRNKPEEALNTAKEFFFDFFRTVGDAYLKFGEVALSALTLDFEGVKKNYIELAKIITGDLIDGIEEAVIAGDKAAQSNIALRGSIRALNVEIGKQARLAENSRRIRDDETLSLRKRIEANADALKFEELRTKAEKARINSQLAILNTQIKLNETDESLLDERANLLRELEDSEEAFQTRITETQTNAFALRKELAETNNATVKAVKVTEVEVTEEANSAIIQSDLDRLAEEVKISEARIEQAKREEEAKQAVKDATIQNAFQSLQTLRQLAGEESAIGKGLLLFQQGKAIADIVSNTAIANAKAVSAFPITLGQPFVGINTLSAGVSIASIIAQTAQAISGGGGFAEGGYTGAGGKYQPAGIVHRGEVVFSQRDVSMMGGVGAVERIRPTSGYADGGVVGASTSSSFRSINSNRELQSSIANNPIFVAVTDINKQQGKYAKVEQRANS